MKKNLCKAIVLFGIGLLLNLSARYITGFAEWYATTIYTWLTAIVGSIFNIIPFSAAEGVIIFTLVLTLFYIIKIIWMMARKQTDKKEENVQFSSVLVVIGFIFLIFQLTCGINYHRSTFSAIENIPITKHSLKELMDVCEWLTEKVNENALLVNRDENGRMLLEPDVSERATQAMKEAGAQYPSLAGYYPKAKPVLCSFVLSYEQLQGVFCSYTMEPLYNRDMPDYKKPSTICHELSHMRGFMREDEAGFIGYLACMGSEYADIRYSGYMSAYVYCMNSLYQEDREGYRELRSKIDVNADSDILDSKQFWASYHGTVAAIADKSNDVYLKANAQSDGVKSYNRIVTLIIALFEMKREL